MPTTPHQSRTHATLSTAPSIPSATDTDAPSAATVPVRTVEAVAPIVPVAPRANAVVDATALHRTEDAAVKRNMFPSRPGYPSGRAHLQTHLHVEAWVRNISYAKHVWVDVHVYGHDGALVHATTLPLVYARPAGDGGDIFVLDAEIFDGAVATPGSVSPKPDVRQVHYRLYAELEGRVLTDGALHRCLLASDASSR